MGPMYEYMSRSGCKGGDKGAWFYPMRRGHESCVGL
jgi:hypothetical protein